MLDELKNYLDVTWDDEKTDSKLSSILSRATTIINSYACNIEVDYSSDYKAKQLLFDCCRYIYNDSLENFSNNFQSEIINLRISYRELEDEESTNV